MKVFVFDLLAYGEQLEHLRVGSELPYPLPNRYFKPDVAVRTYEVMAETYTELGYRLTELPRAAVEQRATFVIAALGKTLPGQI